MNFYLGCAVWSFAGWVGNLYPTQSRSRDFLRLYSQRFTTVEGNTTFYAVPSPQTISRWVEQTPLGFKFCPKFPQTISHGGLLQPAIAEALNFLEIMAGLGDRLGTVFLQLPPSYSPVYLEDLQQFLTGIQQQNLSLAVEVRHLDWFKQERGDRLNEMLAQLNIARVLLDTRPIYNSPEEPQKHSRRRKPQVPLQPVITGNCGFIRFISHPQREYNEPYLQTWISQLASWLKQGKKIYFFVHCPLEERSPDTAKYLHSQLETQNLPVPSLPWQAISPLPTQLSLF